MADDDELKVDGSGNGLQPSGKNLVPVDPYSPKMDDRFEGDPLDGLDLQPAEREAARAIGKGTPFTHIARATRIAARTLYYWLNPGSKHYRPEFHAAVQRYEAEFAREAREKIERDMDMMRFALRSGVASLGKKTDADDETILAKIAASDPESTARTLTTYAKGFEIVHRGSLRARGLNPEEVRSHVAPVLPPDVVPELSKPEDITISATMDEFVQQDLGVPLHEIWPRVMWTLRQIDRSDVRVAVLMIGAGGGKTCIAELTLARQLQRLAAMPTPSAAFGSRSDQLIGVANLSGSGQLQAQMAIFTDLKRDVLKSPWFKSHSPPKDTKDMVLFPKNVVAVSGNSSSISEEGINLVAGAADELSRMDENASNEIRANDLVEPIRKTMITRFPKHYKLVLMSWPSHLEDYMHKEIARAEAEGVAEDLTQAFLDSPITRGTPEEERARREAIGLELWRSHPTRAFVSRSGTFVLRAPLWHMRPDADLNELEKFRTRDRFNFSRMVAASPERAGANPYILDLDKLRRQASTMRKHPFDDAALHEAMSVKWADSDRDRMEATIKACVVEPLEGKGSWLYYGRIDLGIKKDACGAAVDHYEDGRIVTDLMLELKPEAGCPVSVRFVRGIFIVLRSLGFDFGLIEFDSFEGQSNMQAFEEEGFKAAIKSVDRSRRPYDDWRAWLLDGKIDYYPYEPFFECCASLVDMGRKVDHVPGGKKDVTDAAAGLVSTILHEELGIDESP